MHLDTQLGQFDLSQVPAAAQRLERMGFDTLWSFEAQHDPFLPLAQAALATQRIRVGTNIVVAFGRTPLSLAMTAWDLARTSGGRFTLGLGTQVRVHIERRYGTAWGKPAARVKEAIQCIRAIWDCWQNGTKPTFEGQFYQFKLMSPFFNPGPMAHPRIPIFLAGVNPLMCRTGGEVADGFHIHPMHSVKYLREVLRPSIDEGARTRGKTVADLDLCVPAFVVSGNTPAETSERERVIREQLAFYASTPNYRSVLDLHGFTAIGEALSQKVRSGDFANLAKAVPDEMLDAFALSAPPERVARALHERYHGLVTRVSLYFPIPETDPEQRWTQLARDFHAAG